MGVGFGRSSVADLAFQVFNRSAASRLVLDAGVPAHRANGVGGGPPDHRRGPLDPLPLGVGPPHRDPVGPRNGPARARPALSFPSPPRAIHPAPPGWNDRISELPRSGARRSRDLPPPLRGNRARRFRHRLFHRSSRPTAWPPADQSYPDRRRVSDLSIQSFHTFPDECAIVRTQSLFELKLHQPQRLTCRRSLAIGMEPRNHRVRAHLTCGRRNGDAGFERRFRALSGPRGCAKSEISTTEFVCGRWV